MQGENLKLIEFKISVTFQNILAVRELVTTQYYSVNDSDIILTNSVTSAYKVQ